MKNLFARLALASFALCLLYSTVSSAEAQAFTYQGQLTTSGAPANGSYDLAFSLYDAVSNGTQVGLTVTNPATGVTNGLFLVTLDFDGAPYKGQPAVWLQIAVRPAGNSTFTALTPLQPLTPAPYAVQALIAASLTGSVGLSQLPAEVVTNGETGVTISGNGGGLTNVPGTLTWQTPTTTNLNTSPNQGYFLNGSGPSTVTLPTNVNLGDIIAISAGASNGWQIAVGPGQSIAGYTGAPASVWTAQNSGVYLWTSVASSADGSKLVATVFQGPIYTSIDSGVTWVPQNSGSQVWFSVASSADGTKLVAAAANAPIYTSVDSGVTWVAQNIDSQAWESVASSADGTKLAAAGPGTQIYTSSDSGVTWTAQNIDSQIWTSVAMSADGTKLVAVGQGIQIYTSSDSGVTWTAQNSSTQNWLSVASSADGTKLVATVAEGPIYTSSDSGVTWTAQNSGAQHWSSVASSADGIKLIAASGGLQIYLSGDAGVTWTAQNSGMQNWNSVASSADGNKLVATAFLASISTTDITPHSLVVPEPAGATTQLQYLGNGVWQPVGESASQIVGVLSPAQLPANVVTDMESGITLSGTFSGYFFGDVSSADYASQAGTASLAEGVVDGISIANAFLTNAVITNSIFAGDGANVTNLNAGNISNGTISLARLPAQVLTNGEAGVTLGGSITTASNVAGGIRITNATLTNAVITNSILAGDGANVTNLNAGNISSGTISLARLPSQVLTNGANGVTLNGTFSGDGGGLSNLAAWTVVGGSQTVAGNNSYLVTNSSQTTLTLPIAPSVGQVVTVTSSGTGGWSLTTAEGESINGISDWLAETNTPAAIWYGVACSGDGTHLYAVSLFGNNIYASTNSGVTWATTGAPNQSWISIGTSYNGSTILAGGSGFLYLSTNAGVTWQSLASSAFNFNSPGGTAAVLAVTVSSNGNQLSAVFNNGAQWICISTNAGATWTQPISTIGFAESIGSCLAASADGIHIYGVFGESSEAYLLASPDGGRDWDPQGLLPGGITGALACSADGSKVVIGINGGGLYLSSDYGASFSALTGAPTGALWRCMACSSDASTIVAGVSGGALYVSPDSGITWFEQLTGVPTNVSWVGLACSASGATLVGAAGSPFIYTGHAASLSGGPGTLGQLQYTGNGVWQSLGINGANLTGIVPLANLPASLVTNGETAVTLTGTFAGNGAGLTNLNAGNLASGTVPAARLALPTGSASALGVVQVDGTTISANGSGVISATHTGTVTSVSLNVDAAGVMASVAGSPVSSSGSFTPTFASSIRTLSSNNAVNLTNLNATRLASGTVAANLLPINVAYLNANQTFTGANVFNNSNGVGINGLLNVTNPVFGGGITLNNGNQSSSLSIVSPNGSRADFGMATANSSYSADAVSNDVVLRAAVSGQRLMLQTGGGHSAIFIPANNNVGIGTTNPLSGLDVNNSTGLTLESPGAPNNWNIYTFSDGNLILHPSSGGSGSHITPAGAYVQVSDVRLKKDIMPLESVLDRMLKLRPVSYRFKAGPDGANPTLGFIAQEVEPLFPQIVDDMGQGLKGLSYAEFAPVTVKAIQELNQKIEEKDEEIKGLREKSAKVDALEKRLDELEAGLKQLKSQK